MPVKKNWVTKHKIVWVTNLSHKKKFDDRNDFNVEASLDDPSCDFWKKNDTETSRTLTLVDLYTNLLPDFGGDGNLK